MSDHIISMINQSLLGGTRYATSHAHTHAYINIYICMNSAEFELIKASKGGWVEWSVRCRYLDCSVRVLCGFYLILLTIHVLDVLYTNCNQCTVIVPYYQGIRLVAGNWMTAKVPCCVPTSLISHLATISDCLLCRPYTETHAFIHTYEVSTFNCR